MSNAVNGERRFDFRLDARIPLSMYNELYQYKRGREYSVCDMIRDAIERMPLNQKLVCRKRIEQHHKKITMNVEYAHLSRIERGAYRCGTTKMAWMETAIELWLEDYLP